MEWQSCGFAGGSLTPKMEGLVIQMAMAQEADWAHYDVYLKHLDEKKI